MESHLKSTENLGYLLQLLDDDSQEIQRIVRQEILNNSLEIILRKQRYLATLSEAEIERFEAYLEELHHGIVLNAFSQLLSADTESVDLEKSSLVLDYWANPVVSLREVHSRLDTLAEEVAEHMPRRGHPLSFIDHINRVMFQLHGFRGNASDYYNPDNSFLSCVLSTKLGIPISLSTIYMLVANRLSFPVFGVALPAHFILKFDNGEDEIFFDPFHAGKVYSRKTCYDYLAGFKSVSGEKTLDGCSNSDILARIFRNLHIVYSSHTVSAEKVQEIESFLSLMDPASLQ